MKALKDFYSFVFGKSKPNKKRKLTPPSERPKNAYLKYVEHGLINEGILIGQYTGEWVKDQKAWRKYFKANKDFVMISINNANRSIMKKYETGVGRYEFNNETEFKEFNKAIRDYSGEPLVKSETDAKV